MKMFFKGLRSLPPLPTKTQLKSLEARNCGLNEIHHSYFCFGIQVDASHNIIKKLPQAKTLAFLQLGGQLNKDACQVKQDLTN